MPPTASAPLPRPEVSAATSVVGVVGDPVAHSLSPLLHNAAFAELGLDWVSVGFHVYRGNVAAALRGACALGVRGLSVTMPHKETMAGLVDRRTPEVERLGAVNCVVISEGLVTGDNTDGAGFVAGLRRGEDFDPEGRPCLVVGAGGAARAVVAALADAGAGEVVVVNRSPDRGARAAALAGPVGRLGRPDDAAHCDLVVNATPLGMELGDEGAEPGVSTAGRGRTGPGRPAAGPWPIDPEFLSGGQVVVDLVYHPPLTPWLRAARDRGASVSNGLGMLVHQAALQLAAWTGQDVPVDAMWRTASQQG